MRARRAEDTDEDSFRQGFSKEAQRRVRRSKRNDFHVFFDMYRFGGQ
jgi:hypothetical protein